MEEVLERVAGGGDVAGSLQALAQLGVERRRGGHHLRALGRDELRVDVPRRAVDAQPERAGLAETFRVAIEAIPTIRRARVGRRIIHGRPYEQQMRVDYEYAAMLDFDDVGGLKAYLDHPAHDALATRFFEVLEELLVYDFEFQDGDGLASLT